MIIINSFSNRKHLCKTIILLCLFTGQNIFAQNACLIDKDAGINANLTQLDAQYNNPSPYTFDEMIAVNDGGGRFQDYTSNYSNPNGLPNVMLEITDVVRYFVQMQEDFAVTPDVSQLPSETDGVPISMTTNTLNGNFFQSNKATLQGLKDQGFKVHACFAALSPTDGTYSDLRDFPEQWYFVNEWTNNAGINYEGVKLSVKNYTIAFINAMSPPNCSGNNCIVDVFEMGNEPWGYPDPKIYHAIITGAWEAFYEVYGVPSNWKMDFIAPSFQAFRENIVNCDNPNELNAFNLQTDPNYQLCQYDEIGEFLDLPCEVMNDIDAVNIHPYGFKNGDISTFKTEPEHPESEFNQIKNAVVWRDTNFPNRDLPIYSTEFGWSSQPEAANGNGEEGQAANLLRGILIQSRYHINRTYIYNAYEDINPLFNWHALYEAGDSNGIGYPNALGGRKKPAFFAVKDFRNRFAGKVFYKAVQEDRNGVYAYIVANPDGSEPFLVFWTPQETHDYNINELSNEVSVDWSATFPNLGLESTTATTFALDDSAGNTFTAANGNIVAGSAIIAAKRMPAFIKLVPLNNNNNCGGTIKTDCGVTVEQDGFDVNFVTTSHNTNLIIIVRDMTWSEVKPLCNDYNMGMSCTNTSSITVDAAGLYFVDIQIEIEGSDVVENCIFPITVDGTFSGGEDIDGDGICSSQDCNDTDANIGAMQTPGTLCNDGNPNTNNDQILADGCTCLGEGNIVTNNGVSIEIDGLHVNFVSTTHNTNLIILVRGGFWQVAEYLCNDYNEGTDCNGNSSITLPFDGDYIVDIQIPDSGEHFTFPVTVHDSSGSSSDCMVDINLTGVHSSPEIFRVNSTISSSAEVNANVGYYANDRILLDNGFKTEATHDFRAGILGCD